MAKTLAFFVFVCLLQVLPAYAQTSGYTTTLDRHVVVLNRDGLWTDTAELQRKAHDEQAARNGGRIDLTYAASMEKLEIVEAETIKADGRRIAVAADRFIDIAPAISREVALYTDHRTRSIVFPDLEAGDTVRYVYRLTRFDRTWPGQSWHRYLRKAVRVGLFEWIVERPKDMALFVEHHDVDYREETEGDKVRHVFSWKNEKIVADEAGSTWIGNWGPRFVISTFRSYSDVGDYYAEVHRGAAAVTPEVAQLAEKITASTADRRTQARLLFEWVTMNVRYVGVAVGSGKVTPTLAAATIVNRHGDCKASVALLSALLAAKGIASEPALISTGIARYELPATAVADFDHVMLHLPEFDLYVEPTAQYAAFGVLPWGHYDKPVLHAVAGNSHTARVPRLRVEDNVAEASTMVTVWTDGRVTGTTRESAAGAMATDLKRVSLADSSPAKAAAQLRLLGMPGTGKWTKRAVEAGAAKAEVVGELKLSDEVDLAAGEALSPPPGLRFLARPGIFLLGVHDTPRLHPFPCYAGRQIETIEVILPAGLQPTRLPADRNWTTSIAEYHSSYSLRGGTLVVRREFVARPQGQVCTPAQSRELVGFLSNIRRDYRSVVVFDKRS